MIDSLLKKLVAAICYVHKADGTCPNVTISKLKNGNYYTSIVRYVGNHKKVECKKEHRDLSVCLSDLSSDFLKSHKVDQNPLTELHNFMIDECDGYDKKHDED
jgi:hypothetical protein